MSPMKENFYVIHLKMNTETVTKKKLCQRQESLLERMKLNFAQLVGCTDRFADIHKGTLHVTDIPNFKYILIHCGNTDEHTAGCLLVGDSQKNNQINKDGYIGSSTKAYERIYPPIAKALEDNLHRL